MIDRLDQHIIDTYYADYKFFFSKPNVVGIAFGHKITNGINTLESCIQVFVSKKISANYLNVNTLIPTCYKGIKTDVIETGEFIGGGQQSLNPNFGPFPYTSRERPIQPSYCMSNSLFSLPLITGTFGYIVLDNEQRSKTYCLLSTNGTFACLNNAPTGTFIIQPSNEFDGRAPQDTVAKLLKYIRINFDYNIPNNISDFNTVDSSIASLYNPKEVQLINPHIPNIGIPRGITDAALLQSIRWVGCKSGYKRGTVVSLKAILKVNYGRFGVAWFEGVIGCGGDTLQSGDEGALVCDLRTNVLGILFGTSSNVNIICPIKTIQKDLKVTLLTL